MTWGGSGEREFRKHVVGVLLKEVCEDFAGTAILLGIAICLFNCLAGAERAISQSLSLASREIDLRWIV